jgi:Na+-driven multidrug efflux pump
MDTPIKLLPGQALSSDGRPRLDYAAVARLAFPFMLNSAVQAVLNATDTWFIGRLSPTATAAIGAVYWPVLVFVLLFGGVGLAVQTVVAQAYGGRRFARASQATWTAVWASLFTLPLFAALALSGAWMFSPFGIAEETLRLAVEYWFPRMLGAPLRGAGDVRVPSLMVLALSWGFFVPLAHILSFKPGTGWVDWLPQLGFGSIGGWFAALAYICCLGIMLFWRWRSGAWRRVVLPLN